MTEVKTSGNTTNKGSIFTVKPTRLYEKTNLSYEDIQEGDFIIAEAECFVPPQLILFKVSGIIAQMNIEDYDDEKEEEKTKKAVYNCLGKKVVARVRKKENGCLVIERKSIVKDTIEYLSNNLGTIVEATIETISSSGLFIDIGNGVISLLITYEISTSRMNNLKNFFNVGDKIKVRLLEFNPENSFFQVSRKQAYEKLSERELPKGTDVVVTCYDYVNERKDGIFVEIDPVNVGILDIPKESLSPNQFYPGRKVSVSIKKFREKGFVASFVNFI